MRLLLAEDEKELSAALQAVLKRNHYEVDAVYDGQEAYDYLQAGNYDGVILDVMMPVMDGFELLKKIRAERDSIPVLMLTARAEVDDRVMGLDLGADDYLTKPFAMKELLARVRAITRRQNEAESSMLQYGNVTLDLSFFQLQVGDKKERIPNKEFQMLEMLLANPTQIISSERFLEKIWGYDSNVELQIVWVYISYLRKRLKSMDADVVIRAKRNLGYYVEVQR
ncbi:MAG: response regulator transcription factor [Eubacterium sp.]|nr:response regulator transcription factor [Eubacterium sp.]